MSEGEKQAVSKCKHCDDTGYVWDWICCHSPREGHWKECEHCENWKTKAPPGYKKIGKHNYPEKPVYIGLQAAKGEEDFEWTSVRKRPVIVRAVQIHDHFVVGTLEGAHRGSPGDYLICGVRGEMYPCKREIFEETYELVKEE